MTARCATLCSACGMVVWCGLSSGFSLALPLAPCLRAACAQFGSQNAFHPKGVWFQTVVAWGTPTRWPAARERFARVSEPARGAHHQTCRWRAHTGRRPRRNSGIGAERKRARRKQRETTSGERKRASSGMKGGRGQRETEGPRDCCRFGRVRELCGEEVGPGFEWKILIL